MSNGTQVLREYLLSLGFRINTVESKRFDEALRKTDKLALSAGKALVGVGTAASTMVQVFANQMEKLYYASRRTGSTVENLQALEFSAKQIGISGGAINGAISGMARALRANPGLTGLLKNLGVRVEGRDTSDVMKDMVRQLRTLPFYVGSKFASMFGMDEDTFLLMSQNLDKMDEVAEKRKQMNRDAGVDAEAAAKAAVEYNNALDTTLARLGVLKDALSIALLPTMRSAVAYADQFLIKLTNAVQLRSIDKLAELVRETVGDLQSKNAASSAGAGLAEWMKKTPFPQYDWGRGPEGKNYTIADYIRGYGHGGPAYGRAKMVGSGRGFVNPPLVDPNADPRGGTGGAGGQGASELFDRLEKQYALPKGLLMALMGAESSGNLDAQSPTGPKGPFQFARKTGLAYGVTDRNNLGQSATGAAAHMADLIRKYGDLPRAIAAWNMGETDFNRAGATLGGATAEAQGLAARVQRNMQQNLTFNIYGNDPHAVAEAVGQKLDSANAQYLENLKGGVQ